jgi:ribose transport system permease protein
MDIRSLTPYAVLMVFGLAIIVFSALNPSSFATWANVKGILTTQSVLAVAALGVTIPLICGQFDLSVSATISVVGLLTTGLMSRTDVPWVLALTAGILVGITIGLVNGVLVGYGGIHSFIATLGVSTVLSGLALWYSRGQTIFSDIDPQFVSVMRGSLVGVPLPIIYTIVVGFAVWMLLSHVPFGRHLYAIGGNRSAAEIAGVPVRRTIVLSLVTGATLAAVAGVMLASRSASAQPGAGDTYLLPAFAAAFIGAACVKRADFNAVGTLIGVYFVATLVNGAFTLGAQNYVNSLISGSALILAVLANRALASRS